MLMSVTGEMSKRKDLRALEKDRMVMAKRLGHRMYKTAALPICNGQYLSK